MNRAKTIKMGKGIIWVVILLLTLNIAFALGIRPVKTELDFQQHYEGSFKVVNNDHKALRVRIYAEGDLKDFISLPQKELEFSSSEEIKTVQFSLELSEKQLPPGRVEGRIIVEEELYSLDRDDGYVAANLKIAHKVHVDVPFPEKYIEAKVEVDEQEEGVGLITSVKNLGTQDLEEVKPEVKVFSGNEIIESYEHPPEYLDHMEEHSFRDYVEKEKLGKGEFKVLSSISYAEYTLEVIEAFMIGKPIIEIINYDKYFVEKRINELAVELKSEWNTLIENIHLETFVFKDNKEVFNTKTTSFDLQPYEERKVITHFDTRNLELGEYDINLVLYYGNQSTIEKYKAEVLDEESYLKKMQGRNTIVYLLAAVIVVLIAVVMLLAYFGFVMRKCKTKKFK
ncbi:hypothetical protein KY360_03885 [Candidatus Woesearchaeota archaeon]|nr:hypothetical protein [Candidatus Woesearchaeota archaeon]